MTPTPELYRWSSAATHCGCATGKLPLQADIELWGATWDALSWREYLGRTEAESDTEALRASTHTGRPLRSKEFVECLERTLHRVLSPQKGGRPRKSATGSAQSVLPF
ncbi:MAG TPA: hypothetical protein VG675_12760 [Bryobacteraceae bacterium]|nr:hypothetical protein [Bryobacteraceae bacterium]